MISIGYPSAPVWIPPLVFRAASRLCRPLSLPGSSLRACPPDGSGGHAVTGCPYPAARDGQPGAPPTGGLDERDTGPRVRGSH